MLQGRPTQAAHLALVALEGVQPAAHLAQVPERDLGVRAAGEEQVLRVGREGDAVDLNSGRAGGWILVDFFEMIRVSVGFWSAGVGLGCGFQVWVWVGDLGMRLR